MKKYYFLVAIMAALVACNSNNPDKVKDNIVANDFAVCASQLANLDSTNVISMLEKEGFVKQGSNTTEHESGTYLVIEMSTKNRLADTDMSNLKQPAADLSVTLIDNEFAYLEAAIFVPVELYKEFYLDLSNKSYNYMQTEYEFDNKTINSETQNHWKAGIGTATYSNDAEHYANLYLPDDQVAYDAKIIAMGPEATYTRDLFVKHFEKLTVPETDGIYENSYAGCTNPRKKLFYAISATGPVVDDIVFGISYFIEENKNAPADVDVTEHWIW